MIRPLPLSARPAVRLRALVLALVASALLGACGPGVGGTGTGTVTEGNTPAIGSPDGAGTSAGALCSSTFAPLLDCTEPGSSAANAGGTRPVIFADAPAQARATAQFSGEQVMLDLPCVISVFEGSWVATGSGAGSFQGLVRMDAAASAQPATLQVERQGNALVLRLGNETGPILGSPWTLSRVTALPTAPLSCP